MSETWLDLSVLDFEVSLLGYHLYRCDHSCSSGGIGVYVAEYLSCSTLSHSSGFLIIVLSTCGSPLALSNLQKVALLSVAFITHQIYQPVL